MNNLQRRRVSVLALTFTASLALGGCAALALPVLAPILGGGSSGLVKAGDFHNVHIRVPDPPKASEWYVKTL